MGAKSMTREPSELERMVLEAVKAAGGKMTHWDLCFALINKLGDTPENRGKSIDAINKSVDDGLLEDYYYRRPRLRLTPAGRLALQGEKKE